MAHLRLAIEMRFLRIPTEWTAEEAPAWHQNLAAGLPPPPRHKTYAVGAIPAVSPTARPVKIDGWDLRAQFLRLKHDEKSALRFLREVGAWRAERSDLLARGLFDDSPVRAETVWFNKLWEEQQFWRDLLRNRSELRARFGPAPAPSPALTASPNGSLRVAFGTEFLNNFPLHIEWRGGHPYGVVETVTGWEMMVATVQADLLRGAKFKICELKDCATPFPDDHQGKRFCRWYCAHLAAVRRKRKEEKREREKAVKSRRQHAKRW